MTHRLIVPKFWKYRHRKHGMQELPPGEYSVPDQIPMDVADRCVNEGMGTLYRVRMPAFIPVAGVVVDSARDEQPVKRRGRPRKGPAPENKVLHVAENK